MNRPFDTQTSEDELSSDIQLLERCLDLAWREQDGEGVVELVHRLRAEGVALREGRRGGGRDAFAAEVGGLDLQALDGVSRAVTVLFQLINAAEEQQRLRVLRRRDRGTAPLAGGTEAAFAELRGAGASADEMRAFLHRLLVMPVLTAHPTEARRRTVLDHLDEVSRALDRLDDPRIAARDHRRAISVLEEAVLALVSTEESRSARPTPLDEVRAGVHVFERSLLDVTLEVYRDVEDALATTWPGESFDVGRFLRWGSWIGGDRDGNPFVTHEVTRGAFDSQRDVVLGRYVRDVEALGQELSISMRRARPAALARLEAALGPMRDMLPKVAARVRRYRDVEPFREMLWLVRGRLLATRAREPGGYGGPGEYAADLDALHAALGEAGLERLSRGRLKDARRRVGVFGFHLASLDLRQHSGVHEAVVAELLARGGQAGYASLDEAKRVSLLAKLLERADLRAARDDAALSPEARETLATLDVVAQARKELGPEACERYVVSFTRSVSDLLEVLVLARAAGLSPEDLRPVPLLEQGEDLERAEEIGEGILAQPSLRAALRGELEVMVGYSDSGKQMGYVASAVELHRAQTVLAQVADAEGVTLTVFHGRGGAVGRGGGPAARAIHAQPSAALRGRLRVTEQGETIAARYRRPEIARRDLDQMVGAVFIGSFREKNTEPARAARWSGVLEIGASAARAAYDRLLEDPDRLARYALAATPLREISNLPIASRPASRRPGFSLAELRAIPWVFSWNQSRHGLPGWFGLGSALRAIRTAHGEGALRALYADWPFFAALVDNAELALVRADIDVAEQYARLAAPADRAIFERIREEHARTLEELFALTGQSRLFTAWPAIARTVERRNPDVDVLNHAQIALLRRLESATEEGERNRLREVLFVTISGIAAGLQTAG